MRRIAGYVAVLLGAVLLGGGVVAQGPTEAVAQDLTLEDRVCALEVEVGIGLCSGSSTTTDTIPETINHGDIGGRGQNGYSIDLSQIDDPDTATIEPKVDWWKAPYHWDLDYSTDQIGWTPGHRGGYKCAYGFIVRDGTPYFATYPDGEVVQRGFRGGDVLGRFTFLSTGGAGYARVNDAHMEEGVRYYDGTETGGRLRDQELEATAGEHGGCPDNPSGYEPYTGPDERPVVVFRDEAGQVIEIRDYRTIDAPAGLKFRVVDAPDGHDVAVVAYWNNLPVIVVYYDGLNGGTVEVVMP